MKYNLLLSACFYFVILFASSCATTIHTGTARTRNINQGGIKESANMADLTVGESKVTGTSTGQKISDDTAKNLAIYDAVKKANADVLIEPVFDIAKTGNSITVTVDGYPGYYKNFRRPTTRDSLIMGWKVNPPVNSPAAGTGNTTTITTNSPINISTFPSSASPGIKSNNTPPVLQNVISPLNKPKTQAQPYMSPDQFADYKRELKKGRNLVGLGVTLTVLGGIIAGMAPVEFNANAPQVYDRYTDTYEPDPNATFDAGAWALVGVGSAMGVAGIAMFSAGAKHIAIAKRMKKSAIQACDLNILPSLNFTHNIYGGALTMNF